MTSNKRACVAVQSKDEILQAALEEFAEHGFGAATVRRIAGRCGKTHGLIRYHYDTKEALWFDAVAYLFERLDSALRPADETERSSDDPRAAFRRTLRRYVRYCAEHPEHARILMQETVHPTERMRIAVGRHVRSSHERFSEQLETLKDLGVFPTEAPTASIIYMITGACQNLFALAPEAAETLGYDALTDEAIEAHADLMIAMFCPQ